MDPQTGIIFNDEVLHDHAALMILRADPFANSLNVQMCDFSIPGVPDIWGMKPSPCLSHSISSLPRRSFRFDHRQLPWPGQTSAFLYGSDNN
jgi:hypothetical protein